MSAHATGWVWGHSPYTGAQLLVHLAIGDVVNDANDHEFWMLNEKLATKARVSLSTVTRTLSDLCKRELLREIERGVGRGNPSRYEMLFPPEESTSPGRTSSRGKARQLRRESTSSATRKHVICDERTIPPTKENSMNGDEHDVLALELVDSLRPSTAQLARAITQRVFETKRPKPATPFPGVLKIAKRLLEAGWAEGEIEAAMHRARTISTGWVEAELSKSKPRSRAVDTDRSSPEGRITI